GPRHVTTSSPRDPTRAHARRGPRARRRPVPLIGIGFAGLPGRADIVPCQDSADLHLTSKETARGRYDRGEDRSGPALRRADLTGTARPAAAHSARRVPDRGGEAAGT